MLAAWLAARQSILPPAAAPAVPVVPGRWGWKSRGDPRAGGIDRVAYLNDVIGRQVLLTQAEGHEFEVALDLSHRDARVLVATWGGAAAGAVTTFRMLHARQAEVLATPCDPAYSLFCRLWPRNTAESASRHHANLCGPGELPPFELFNAVGTLGLAITCVLVSLGSDDDKRGLLREIADQMHRLAAGVRGGFASLQGLVQRFNEVAALYGLTESR